MLIRITRLLLLCGGVQAASLALVNGNVIDVEKGRVLPATTEILVHSIDDAPVDEAFIKHRDLEAFLEPYSDEVEIYNFPDELRSKGKAAMRAAALFDASPQLHAELVNRIELGDTVVDRERVTGARGKPVEAIAIYNVKDGKISRVTFVQ